MTGKRILVPKPVRFLIAGGFAALVEYCAFILIVSALPGAIIFGQITSYLFGFFISFWLQRNWAFKSKGGIKGEIVKYTILAAINLALGTVIIWILIDLLGVSSYMAKLIIMVLVAIWNYVIFNRVIFSKTNA